MGHCYYNNIYKSVQGRSIENKSTTIELGKTVNEAVNNSAIIIQFKYALQHKTADLLNHCR